MSNSTILTRENWKDCVLEAIRDLPKDLQASVGYSFVSDDIIVVTVAAEPMERQEDTCMRKAQIRFWNTKREQGWPPEFECIYGPGGINEAQADWPVVSVEGESSECEQGFNVGRSPAILLTGQVQVAILEEMYSGGGTSMVFKDGKGRFYRENGSRILDWQ